jgi:hypothetical protein
MSFVYRHRGRAYRRAYYNRGGFWYWYDLPIATAPAAADTGNPAPDCDPSADECGPPDDDNPNAAPVTPSDMSPVDP